MSTLQLWSDTKIQNDKTSNPSVGLFRLPITIFKLLTAKFDRPDVCSLIM